MMKWITLNILLIISINLTAQQLYPTEINTLGDMNTTDGISLSYSVGGLAVNTLYNYNILTQGFQQSYNLFLSEPKYLTELKLKAKVFPNPTNDIMHLSVISDTETILSYIRILDANGKVMHAPTEYFEFTKGQNITLNLKNIAHGTYLLQVVSKKSNEVLVQFKVVKL